VGYGGKRHCYGGEEVGNGTVRWGRGRKWYRTVGKRWEMVPYGGEEVGNGTVRWGRGGKWYCRVGKGWKMHLGNGTSCVGKGWEKALIRVGKRWETMPYGGK
jgi:hypothetical protein